MHTGLRILSLSVLTISIGLAGPPGGGRAGGGGGYFASGPISGPAPVGATGPAPVGAAGNLLRTPSPVYRNGFVSTTPYRNGSAGTVRSNGNRYYDRNRHRVPYALFLSPYATLPYYGYDDAAGFDYANGPGEDAGPGPNTPLDPTTQGLMAGQDQLGQQVQQLSAELEQLKMQRAQANGYAPGPPPAAPATADQDQPQNTVPITIVLTNGKQVKVKNYAVMDGVLWDFSGQPSHKIPLSSINVEASAQATQANGGEFPDLGAQ